MWDIADSSVLVTEKYEDLAATTTTDNRNIDDYYDDDSNDVDHDTKQKC